jgi:hypothetical protein
MYRLHLQRVLLLLHRVLLLHRLVLLQRVLLLQGRLLLQRLLLLQGLLVQGGLLLLQRLVLRRRQLVLLQHVGLGLLLRGGQLLVGAGQLLLRRQRRQLLLHVGLLQVMLLLHGCIRQGQLLHRDLLHGRKRLRHERSRGQQGGGAAAAAPGNAQPVRTLLLLLLGGGGKQGIHGSLADEGDAPHGALRSAAARMGAGIGWHGVDGCLHAGGPAKPDSKKGTHTRHVQVGSHSKLAWLAYLCWAASDARAWMCRPASMSVVAAVPAGWPSPAEGGTDGPACQPM